MCPKTHITLHFTLEFIYWIKGQILRSSFFSSFDDLNFRKYLRDFPPQCIQETLRHQASTPICKQLFHVSCDFISWMSLFPSQSCKMADDSCTTSHFLCCSYQIPTKDFNVFVFYRMKSSLQPFWIFCLSNAVFMHYNQV